jgi:transcriptional regulator with XRE-family HTH domain
MYVFDGGRLLQYRKVSGLTQDQIARSLETSQQSVARWESGKSEPGLSQLCYLADMYGVTLDELVGRKSPEADAERIAPVVEREPDHSINEADLARVTSAIKRIASAAKLLEGVFLPETQ